jgi:hypothetical protein
VLALRQACRLALAPAAAAPVPVPAPLTTASSTTTAEVAPVMVPGAGDAGGTPPGSPPTEALLAYAMALTADAAPVPVPVPVPAPVPVPVPVALSAPVGGWVLATTATSLPALAPLPAYVRAPCVGGRAHPRKVVMIACLSECVCVSVPMCVFVHTAVHV